MPNLATAGLERVRDAQEAAAAADDADVLEEFRDYDGDIETDESVSLDGGEAGVLVAAVDRDGRASEDELAVPGQCRGSRERPDFESVRAELERPAAAHVVGPVVHFSVRVAEGDVELAGLDDHGTVVVEQRPECLLAGRGRLGDRSASEVLDEAGVGSRFEVGIGLDRELAGIEERSPRRPR